MSSIPDSERRLLLTSNNDSSSSSAPATSSHALAAAMAFSRQRSLNETSLLVRNSSSGYDDPFGQSPTLSAQFAACGLQYGEMHATADIVARKGIIPDEVLRDDADDEAADARLNVRPVEVTERIIAAQDADDQLTSEWQVLVFWARSDNWYLALAIAISIGWMCLPCTRPQSFYIQVFLYATGLFAAMTASFLFIGQLVMCPSRVSVAKEVVVLIVLLLLCVVLTAGTITQVLIALHIRESNLKFNYWSIAISLTFASAGFFRWLRQEHPAVAPILKGPVPMLWAVFVLTMYVYLGGLVVLLNDFTAISHRARAIQFLVVVGFFVWNAFFHRFHQTLLRRVAAHVVAVEGRSISWRELAHLQVVFFFHSSVQYAAYRTLFAHAEGWMTTVPLILMHHLSEALMYVCRLPRRMRNLERAAIARLPKPLLFLVEPLLPIPVWLDLLCLDYFLRKLAEIVTLVMFVVFLVLFRYGYMRECYIPYYLSESDFQRLLVICGVQLLLEVVSGYFTRRYICHTHHRGFLFRAVMKPTLPRLAALSAILFGSCLGVLCGSGDHKTFQQP